MNGVFENYIAGDWCGGDECSENINPSDLNDIIGTYAQARPTQINDAVAAASEAQQIWAKFGLEKRQDVLQSIGQELIARSRELGELLSREEGKPLAEGIGEVYRSGQFFTYYAAECLRQQGDFQDFVRDGVEVSVRREPVGVIAVVSPWNFPLATASWKIAPALAFGNAVVWKPANLTPASAWAFAEIMSRQNLPAGTFNLVMGTGNGIGRRLVESPEIDGVSFTGSYEVGKDVAMKAAANFTKVQLELGSKNALLVMDDADLDLAVGCAVNGAFSGTGQKCTASSRLILHASIHDAFVEQMVARMKALKVGHALAEDTQIGPLASHSQMSTVLEYIQLAKEEGCELVWGGERLERDTDGFYLSPALFISSSNEMRVNQEEIFGPVACVQKVGSYEEGLARVNDTSFGLTAGIATRSHARATHFRRNAEAGCVMVNLPTAGTDYHVPFGGRKNSSFGPREQGRYAVEFYTQVKTAYSWAGDPA